MFKEDIFLQCTIPLFMIFNIVIFKGISYHFSKLFLLFVTQRNALIIQAAKYHSHYAVKTLLELLELLIQWTENVNSLPYQSYHCGRKESIKWLLPIEEWLYFPQLWHKISLICETDEQQEENTTKNNIKKSLNWYNSLFFILELLRLKYHVSMIK